jgi:exosortase/archaeosortase
MSTVLRLVLPLLAVTFALVARPHLATTLALKPWVAALLAGAAYGLFAYSIMVSRGTRAAESRAVFMALVVAQTVLLPRAKTLGAAIAFVISVTLLFIYVQNIEQ